MKYLFIAAVLGIVLISGCVGQAACEAPAVTIGSKCCIDADSNKICDADETSPTGQVISGAPKCGDGTCSADEACNYNGGTNKYATSCLADCGKCAGFIILSTAQTGPNVVNSYTCTGYADGVCTGSGSKFTIKNQIGPYLDTPMRGFKTVLKNVGENPATNIKSSFKCYRDSDLVLSSDEQTYKGITVMDYFWDYVMKVQSIDSLAPYAEKSKYYIYYLHFDIAKLEEDMVLKCSVTLSADGGWNNVQELEITFLK